jgi:acetoin utilization deacetylase AcuC-like enzyme
MVETMQPAFIIHEVSGLHEVPPGHPERPERHRAIMSAMGDDFLHWTHHQAPKASRDQLELVHSASYVEQMFEATATIADLVPLDADTWAGPHSLETALRAVGGACLAVDLVMQNKASTAFSAMRPPGHHAEPEQAMGFCLFSSAAIAARHAQHVWGIDRVAVVDFDVHHGNGTQAAFWDDASLIYASSHQMPLYPGTGAANEQGAHNNIFNLPCAPGMSGAAIIAGWRDHLLPAIVDAAPDLVIISAGFDAHIDDPLGGLAMQSADFATLTSDIGACVQQIADASGGCRLISLLEGGYNLDALGQSVCLHLRALESL